MAITLFIVWTLMVGFMFRHMQLNRVDPMFLPEAYRSKTIHGILSFFMMLGWVLTIVVFIVDWRYALGLSLIYYFVLGNMVLAPLAERLVMRPIIGLLAKRVKEHVGKNTE